jgi:hypothetical protein
MKAQQCQHDYYQINDGAGRLMPGRPWVVTFGRSATV